MKKSLFRSLLTVFMLLCLTACMKDDLSNIDVKVDGSVKTTFSTGSSGSGAYSRTRTGLSF